MKGGNEIIKPIDGRGFISDRDIMIAVIANIFGVFTLTLSREVAKDTSSTDGWIAILLGGAIACILGWTIAKIVMAFPNYSFYSFASYLLSKPIAILLTAIFSLQYFMFTAFHIREISALAHQYYFDRTPIEVITLSFLLVVVYAVSGSHAGIFRLNTIFLPITVIGLLILILLPFGIIQKEDFLPVFQTDLTGYIKATHSSIVSFIGFSIVLFYISLVKKPKQTAKLTVYGIGFAVIINVILYVVCVGVLGNMTTANLFFPTFDLSKTVEIPGGFFDRFDSILFAIWTIVIFTTALISYDILVMTIRMIFTKIKKETLIFILSPLLFFVSMLPENYMELIKFSRFLNDFMLTYLIIVTILLVVSYKIKGGLRNG